MLIQYHHAVVGVFSVSTPVHSDSAGASGQQRASYCLQSVDTVTDLCLCLWWSNTKLVFCCSLELLFAVIFNIISIILCVVNWYQWTVSYFKSSYIVHKNNCYKIFLMTFCSLTFLFQQWFHISSKETFLDQPHFRAQKKYSRGRVVIRAVIKEQCRSGWFSQKFRLLFQSIQNR